MLNPFNGRLTEGVSISISCAMKCNCACSDFYDRRVSKPFPTCYMPPPTSSVRSKEHYVVYIRCNINSVIHCLSAAAFYSTFYTNKTICEDWPSIYNDVSMMFTIPWDLVYLGKIIAMSRLSDVILYNVIGIDKRIHPKQICRLE